MDDLLTYTDSFFTDNPKSGPSGNRELEIEYYFREDLLLKVKGFPAPSRGDYVSLPENENLKVRSVVHYPDKFLVVAFLVDPKDY